MNKFLAWNSALASHFFRPESAGQYVWLYVTEEVVDSIGSSAELGGVTDFVNAAKCGPPWPTPSGLCQRALKTHQGWRERDLEYPPYVIYLGLFVLAAGVEGDFASHAYYPRLRTLLGEPPTTGELPSFHRMYELWDDLERWSTRDREGELGIFQSRITGGMFHVGLPLGQSLLGDQDRRMLPAIFARANLDPSTPSPDAEILRALRTHGAGRLRPRTTKLLTGTGEREALATLLELVADELSEWDGQAPTESGRSGTHGDQQVHAGLRLSIRLERPAARARVMLRCTLNRREYPEGGLVLSLGCDEVTCDEEVPGWSTALTNEASGRPHDAALIDWMAGITAIEKRLGWKFRLASRRVRVLVDGTLLGLPGLIEVHLLPRDRDFYLAFHDEEWRYLETWTQTGCENFKLIPVKEGLPSGWRLASASRASSVSAAVASRYPALSLPERIDMRLAGGIRSGPGASFFAFAPPYVIIERGIAALELRCNDRFLQVASDGVSYFLPDDLPVETRIVLEAVAGNDVVRRQSLYLTGEFSWNRNDPQEFFDEWGERVSRPEQRRLVAGAMVETEGNAPYRPPALLVPALSSYPGRRIFFVGRAPGEIVTWPSEPLPKAWDPVWAVTMARRGVALFCGTGIRDCLPAETIGLDRRRLEQWKYVLWHLRKRIVPPSQPAVAALWRRYSEAARHV